MIKAKYYDGVTSNSHDAQIELWSNRIYIVTGAGPVEWFYEKCHITEKANRHADGKIGYDDAPEAQLVFSDIESFRQVAEKLPKRKQQPIYKSVLLYIFSIALLLFAVFYMVPALAPAIGDNLPKSWEEKLGNVVRKSFTTKYDTCSNKEGQAALDKIIAHLGKNSGSKYNFDAVVVKNKDMNAFAAPAGRFMIFSGLIDKADNESQIEGVLAHEMGHAVERHGVDGLIRTLITTFIIDVITGGGGSAIYLGNELYQMDYNRSAEVEADKYALELLAKSDIDPKGLHDFFLKVDKEEKEFQKTTFGKYTKDYDLTFLSTHPATRERMAMVKAAVDPSKTYNNILTLQEWNALKAICE